MAQQDQSPPAQLLLLQMPGARAGQPGWLMHLLPALQLGRDRSTLGLLAFIQKGI